MNADARVCTFSAAQIVANTCTTRHPKRTKGEKKRRRRRGSKRGGGGKRNSKWKEEEKAVSSKQKRKTESEILRSNE